MPRPGDDPVTVEDLMLLVDRPKALGVTTDIMPFSSQAIAKACGPKPVEFWIPKSQIEEHSFDKIGSVGMIVMKRWLADKNELVYTE